MMWTLQEIAQAVNGKLHQADPTTQVSGVQFDSRKLQPADLFVPLVAERDGHDFIGSAVENGAVAAFWSQELTMAPDAFPLILVEDTHRALVDFAKWHLAQVSPTKIAITGSNGKTTTKDMVAAVSSMKFKTHKTEGNFNNDIGVPVTILAMPKDTQVIVVEMGMDKPGEISTLTRMVEPDIAIVTMIGESHIEFFGSREKIAKAKLEILEGLKENGLFIANGDEPLLEEAVGQTSRVKTFGSQLDNDLYPVTMETEKRQTQFTTNYDEDNLLSIPTPGIYNVNNALAAILAGLELDIPFADIAEGLKSFQLTKNRLEWLKGYRGASILNDAYNASPSSMKAVLNYFCNLETSGRKIAVLGDIRELGDLSKELHQSISQEIDAEAIDVLLLYGPEMKALYESLQNKFKVGSLRHFNGDKTELVNTLKDIMQASDTVLLKSSLGTGLIKVVDEIKID